MKKARANIDRYFDRLDQRWRALPVPKQHQYTLYLFAGYLLLTAAVIFNVGCNTSTSRNDMLIEHIGHPFLERSVSPESGQDTLLTILKDKIHEKK